MKFITNSEALSARVKQRYSDFIVEEIYIENNTEKKCNVKRFNIPYEERGDYVKMTIPENKDNKEHLILEMEKINTDTNKAIALISRGLGVGKNRIGYAGLKDKRAITSQRISVFEPKLEKVVNFGVKGIELRNPSFGERIELGDLKGNYFTLTLRNIEKNKEEIKKIISEFSEQTKFGIPNFFGTQRFGGKRNVTHKVGKALLKEDYKEAVIQYLTKTYEEEKEDIKKARINLATTMDYKQALKDFPKECRQEIAILNHLAKNEDDYLGAFNNLPKKIRILFIHAYQSYLFNKIIEKRIEVFGNDALKEQDGDILENEIVTAPLFGFESKFSEGVAGEIEKEILDSEGIDFEFFKVRSQSELSSKGSRKEIALFVSDFELESIIDDEFNEGKKAIIIKFFLTKGNYATTVLRELIKEEIF
jgi:tRNA pseudouridine13 synthase